MIFIKLKRLIFVFFLIYSTTAYGNESKSNRIEVLVNENIITKYDIIQRLKINSILKRIEINDNNYNQVLSSVIDDLVVEKLKVNKIEEYNIGFDEEEFKNYERRFYDSLNYKKQDLEELFSLNNIDFNYLLEVIEFELKWQKLIYGLYLRVSSVTEQEVLDLISKNPQIDKETAYDMILQKQLEIKSNKLINDLRDEATIEYK
tara:strand:- start:64 stop:675 length:612 start_codon:yes stop_codon:yes gene_type:complete